MGGVNGWAKCQIDILGIGLKPWSLVYLKRRNCIKSCTHSWMLAWRRGELSGTRAVRRTLAASPEQHVLFMALEDAWAIMVTWQSIPSDLSSRSSRSCGHTCSLDSMDQCSYILFSLGQPKRQATRIMTRGRGSYDRQVDFIASVSVTLHCWIHHIPCMMLCWSDVCSCARIWRITQLSDCGPFLLRFKHIGYHELMPYLPNEKEHMAPYMQQTGPEFASNYGFSSSTCLRLHRVIYQAIFITMCTKLQ